jgi:hypothetical protein
MSIFSFGFLGVFAAGIAMAAGLTPMTEALERGDRDEASRLGMVAGPAVVEAGLVSSERMTALAAVLAAPHVEGRPELLPALASTAASPDRRIAIPAARAARAIARELSRRDELPDDIADDDVTTWRALFESLAQNDGRFIEIRVVALDTAAALALAVDPDALGFDLSAALADDDPAYRAAAIATLPRPTPAAARAALAEAVTSDVDAAVALDAAEALCGDDPVPALGLLGTQGLDRITKLVAGKPARTTRDAAKCLTR